METSLIQVKEVEELSDLDAEEASRELCEGSLKYLCREVLGFKDWDCCHDDLEDFVTDDSGRSNLILMPRGHLKTSIITIGKCIQEILKDFDTRILLASDIWDNARKFLYEIKEYLTDKSELPSLYGKFSSDFWNMDEVVIRQRVKANKTPTISTAGVDKALASQHYKVIFCDDLVNRQTISTPEQREKTLKFYSDCLDLLDPDGYLWFVGTRWHDADLYGHLIRMEKDRFKVYIRKAIEDGSVIFPKKFSKKTLDELKASKGTWEFNSQYMNDPVLESSCHFPKPVRYWSEIPTNTGHTITVDLAISEKTYADYTVVMDCCRLGSGQLCVYDYSRGHYTVSDTVNKIFEYVVRAKGRTDKVNVGIEATAYQKALVQIVQKEQRERGISFDVIELHPHTDKFSRIIALQPLWQGGNLLLKQGMVELEDEISRFPVAEHDDLCDALAAQLLMPHSFGASYFSRGYTPERWLKGDIYA